MDIARTGRPGVDPRSLDTIGMRRAQCRQCNICRGTDQEGSVPGQPQTSVIIATPLGDIAVELASERAPVTVANFLRYVDGGLYDGGRFHRTVTLGNQSNANLKAEKIGAGIDPDADRAQLPGAYVRQQRKDAFTTAERRKVLNTLFFWHYDISSGVRLRIFAVCFIAFWALAAARLYTRRPGMNGALVVLGVAWASLFASLTLEARSYRNEPRGVILAEETIARKGDGETYQPSFAEPLHAGTEFRVREDRGAWLYVVLPDDRACWIRRDAAGLVRETPGEEQRAPG